MSRAKDNPPVTKRFVREMRVAPGSSPRLDQRKPDIRPRGLDKMKGLDRLADRVESLGVQHARLAAEGTRAVLLILQGLDAAGKDGTIKSVLTGVNPQGCRIVSFKEPTATDLAHDYLWRVHALCPTRGELGIFNRSHYEDVVAVRVRKLAPGNVWRRRYEHIRGFERMLVDEGTTIVKVFLHVSRDEQRKRLQERIDDPEKRWKLQLGDLDDRKLWDQFTKAYEDVIRETSTDWAPWHVVPADHNWVRNLAVAELLVETLERLDPQLPSADPALDGIEIV
ncbi:MAG TPA: PPK2 family polyphosphate kinase [Gaiellaceae bacterium]|nr:PPK2 family polyphosphate kinase [Gaiellaceae bacterium]